VISVDSAGLLSFITFSWMSKYIYKAYKAGLTTEDIPEVSPLDSCDLNAQRYIAKSYIFTESVNS
jgi:ATP-binding cassette subfamily C (CFTR/MRP) protein 5